MCEFKHKPKGTPGNSKISSILVILFLIAVTLRYPLLLLYPFPGDARAGDFFTIDLSAISSLSLFMVLVSNRFHLFLKSSKLFKYPLLIISAIAVLQFFIFDNYTYREFTFSLSWFIISLSVYIYGDTFKKMILPYFTFLWLFNAIYAGKQIFTNFQCIGIPANRNWHGALLIGCTPVFIYALYRLLKKMKLDVMGIIPILCLPALFSLVALYKCYSRGANLALTVTGIVFLIVLIRNLRPRYYKRILIISSTGVIIIFVAGFLLYGEIISHFIKLDVRIPLWWGAIDLFFNNLTTGTGTVGYESQYVFHIPIDRFIRSWYFTFRSDNPHNHILYLLGSFGIFGGTALIFLWIYPIIACFRKYDELPTFIKVVFFSFIALSIHSCFDLIILKWPTVYMAFILQGILWREVFLLKSSSELTEQRNFNHSSVFNLFCTGVTYVAGILIFFQTYILVRNNTYGSSASRKALCFYDNSVKPYSLFYFDKSSRTNRDTASIYRAGVISLIDYNDHILALKYFKALERHPARFYAQFNSHMANCYIRMNRKKDALEYMKQEVKIFPISVNAHYNKLLLEKELNKTSEAEKTGARLYWIIKMKSLSPEDVKKILGNPELDGRYHMLKE